MNSLYVYVGIFKQGHHKAIKASISWNQRQTCMIDLISKVRKIHPGMGARSIYLLTRPEGIGMNRFERMVIENGLGVKKRKRSWKTTDSKHHYHKYPNLINGLKLNDVNQVWVTDITYYITDKITYYLIFIMDLYSRRILGSNVSDNMFSENNIEALKASFDIRKKYVYNNLIHHSDKGSQYCSNAYIKILKEANCQISMADNSLENGYAERLNGVIKNHYLSYREITSLESLKAISEKSIKAYNYEKPHSSLAGSRSPIAFEKYIKTLNIQERPIMELHDFKPPG